MITFVLAFTIGSGILFFTVTIVGAYPGSNPFLALLIDVIPLFSGAAVVYMLGTMIPRVGGQYVWVSRIINPSIGYFVNLFAWLGYCIIMGVVAYIGASYLTESFTIAGLVLHSSTVTSYGRALTQTGNIVLLAIFITFILTLLAFLGHRVSRWTVYITFFVPLVVLLISDIGMLVLSPSKVPSLWDHVFGTGAYQNVISSSNAKGWTSALIVPSISATFLAAIPLISSWSGFSHFAGWASGETKVPRKSMFYGTLGAGVIAFFLMAFTILSYQHLYGAAFISRLYMVSGSLGITLSIPLLGAVAFGNIAFLAVLIGFITFLFPIKDVFPSIIFQARQIFGAAFDRLLPQKLLYVGKRSGQPIISYAVTSVAIMIAIVMVSPFFKLGLFVGSALYVISIGFLQLFTALAAISLPITRRELYERGGSKREIAGIPLISLLGILSFASWTFLLGDSFFNAFNSSEGFTVMFVISLIIGIIFLLYTYYITRLARMGVNVSLIGKEIPPT